MCSTALRRTISKASKAAEGERYRRYANAKSKIPLNLSPEEYETAVRKLAKRYHI